MHTSTKRHLILENSIWINNLSIHIPANKLNLSWDDAKEYCYRKGPGWRLPSLFECLEIIHHVHQDAETVCGYGASYRMSDYVRTNYPFFSPSVSPCWTGTEIHGSDSVYLAKSQLDYSEYARIDEDNSFYYSNNKFKSTARFLAVRNS